jgi:hypothetical protein
MSETVLVIGGTGELGAPVAGQLHSDAAGSGCWHEDSQQPATATPI